jgi:hypothetical protein
MADEKVYGIAESKSKIEVPRKSDVYNKSETYAKNEVYPKSDVYSKSQSDSKFLTDVTGARKNHQSTLGTYGLGTAEMFGHCMLVNTFNPPTGNQDGKALSAAAGYALKQNIDTQVADLIAYINTAIENASRIPVNSFIFSNTKYTSVEMTERMGYGTWDYCFKTQFLDMETAGSYWSAYAYKRIG